MDEIFLLLEIFSKVSETNLYLWAHLILFKDYSAAPRLASKPHLRIISQDA
jgi:hypothetical protein